jgi:hypothetical protein
VAEHAVNAVAVEEQRAAFEGHTVDFRLKRKFWLTKVERESHDFSHFF